MIKIKLLFIAIATLAIISCESNQEEILDSLSSDMEQQELLTRSVSEDSISSDILTPLVATPEQWEMLKRPKPMNAPSVPSSEYDEDYFSSNIYAIRELPVYIKVKSAATGSNEKYQFWHCLGAGEEVELSQHRSDAVHPDRRRKCGHEFYIKVLPPSSGMQYLIYSGKSNTPITIGHYDKTPNVKVLMSQKDNSSYSDFVGWNLVPSTKFKGYFGILNNLYYGQTDPNNMWSIFNYTIEAMPDNKLGFAKPDTNKEQQNFLITPFASFKLVSIEYDLDNVQVHEQIEDHFGTGQNLSSQKKKVNVQFNFNALENSYYNMANNTLKVDVKDTIIACPRMSGSDIMPPTSDNLDKHNRVPFESSSVHHMSRPLTYTMEYDCPARKNIKMKAHFLKYNVSTKFIAKVQLKDKNNDVREVKITGTWSALLYGDPNILAPKYDDPIYTNIGDPDEPIIISDFKPIIIDTIPKAK